MHTSKISLLSAESPSVPPSNPAELQPTGRSRKKIFIAVGVIAIIVVALIAIVFLASSSFFAQGEPIKLSFSYAVGEEMTYNITMTADLLGQTETQTGTIAQKIQSIEGNVYTILTTTEMPPAASETYTMKMDKTGHLIDVGDMPDSMQSLYNSFSFLPG